VNNPPFSLALDKIIGKLQDVKLCISECSAHVDFDSDDMSQLILWRGDIEFIEHLIGDFMYERGLKTRKTPATRHIKHPRKVTLVHPEDLDEEWIGRKHSA